jgi:hypothetical protein
MEKKTIVQKLKKSSSSQIEVAIRYYTILFAVNDIHLTKREIQLIAFTAAKGNISYPDIREEFYNTYNSSSPTMNNIISKLKKQFILIKEGGKIKVNPRILLDFNENIILQISLENG